MPLLSSVTRYIKVQRALCQSSNAFRTLWSRMLRSDTGTRVSNGQQTIGQRSESSRAEMESQGARRQTFNSAQIALFTRATRMVEFLSKHIWIQSDGSCNRAKLMGYSVKTAMI